MLKYAWGRAACIFGASRKYTAIDFSRVERIVFVCVGNVCRSPFAEHLVMQERNLSDIKVCSCGLRTSGGTPANDQAVIAARAFGVDLSAHRSTRISKLKLDGSDLLIGMEPLQLRALPADVRRSGAQLSLLGVWEKNPSLYIQDPYGRCDEYFKTCYSRIQEAVEALAVGFG